MLTWKFRNMGLEASEHACAWRMEGDPGRSYTGLEEEGSRKAVKVDREIGEIGGLETQRAARGQVLSAVGSSRSGRRRTEGEPGCDGLRNEWE